MKFIKYLMFVIIPLFSVFICLCFRIAQGEKIEEVVFGLILGVVLDIIYLLILLIIRRKNRD